MGHPRLVSTPNEATRLEARCAMDEERKRAQRANTDHVATENAAKRSGWAQNNELVQCSGLKAGRRVAVFNTRVSPKLAIPRPLAAGPTKRRTGEHGFLSFLQQCQRLLATASYRGSAKYSMDALGILLVPLLAARVPLERHFLTLSSRTKTGARKEQTCYPATSDAVLLSFDKERNWARWKTVQIGIKPVAGSARAEVGNAGGDAAKDVSERRGIGDGGLPPRKPAAPLTPSDVAPLEASVAQVGPTLVRPSGSTWQAPSRSGRTFLTIRPSQYVYQSQEWKCNGVTLYRLLTSDIMINVHRIDQISFESGQFFLASLKGLCTGAKSGHAIHLWRYGAVQRKLYISQSILFLREQDYREALTQLQEH